MFTKVPLEILPDIIDVYNYAKLKIAQLLTSEHREINLCKIKDSLDLTSITLPYYNSISYNKEGFCTTKELFINNISFPIPPNTKITSGIIRTVITNFLNYVDGKPKF